MSWLAWVMAIVMVCIFVILIAVLAYIFDMADSLEELKEAMINRQNAASDSSMATAAGDSKYVQGYNIRNGENKERWL